MKGKIAPLGRVAATNQLRLAISLPIRNAPALTNLLREIYTPGSPEFHHFLKPAEFTARFGPAVADYEMVKHFAVTNGFKVLATHSNRLVLDVVAPAAAIERAFHVRLDFFKHPSEKRTFFAPDSEPTVDAALPVLHISGLDNFSIPHPEVQLAPRLPSTETFPKGGSAPGGGYMGNDFRNAYVPGTPLTGAGQNIALLQFDAFYSEDITSYADLIGLTNDLPQIVVVPVDGGVGSPGAGGLEVSLDIEMALSMAPGVSNIYVYEAPNPSPWEDLLSQIANDNLASQVSCSWGGGDPDAAAEQIFLQMAAQGQTFFNATGDSDAFTGPVEFPSESPNITQVGGTTLTTDTNGDYISETVWNWGWHNGSYVGSSGGISSRVPIPNWQLGISMANNQGSATMRNLPDVALIADQVYVICNNGQAVYVGGTSCAAPLWAAFTALVNQQASQLSQPAVGFLNPAIYALCLGTNYPAIFHDITTGNNTSADSPTNFYAVPGYDLCTGWGTPNGTNLINALLAPDCLWINPQDFSTSALVGETLTQTNWTFLLTNSGASSLSWSLGGLPAWLSASTNAGTLDAFGCTSIQLQFIGANNFPASIQSAALTLTNLNLSRVQIVALQLAIGQSVVINGGFETGDFTGWTLVGDTVIGNDFFNAVTGASQFPGVVHSGDFGAFLGERGFLATLTQTLPTVVGQQYQVSFWLDNLTAGGGQQFIANWGATNLLNLDEPSTFDWTNFEFVVTASATNTDLQFAAENDSAYFGLDDVSVTPIPPVVISSVMASGGDLQLGWNSLSGLSYQLEFTTDLSAVNWQNLATITATTNVATFADTNTLNIASQRFYQLILLP